MSQSSEPPWVDRAITADTLLGSATEQWYAGVLSLFRRNYAKDPTGADVAILGVPYDLAVTNRPGTRFGPRGIRQASTMISWPGSHWRWDFDPFQRIAVVDTGDMYFDSGTPQGIPEEIRAEAKRIIECGTKLFTLGGDHFITYPLLQAHAEKYGPMALVQFDSHSDTWSEETSRIDHGTMFFHAVQQGIIDPARSIQVGIRSGNPETHGFEIVSADETIDTPPDQLAQRICQRVGAGPAYFTFDIDFLDPAYAPGTGTPVCGGPSTNHAERIVCGLGGIDFVGMDLVEVAPSYDHAEITSLAAATIALNMLCLWAAGTSDTK